MWKRQRDFTDVINVPNQSDLGVNQGGLGGPDLIRRALGSGFRSSLSSETQSCKDSLLLALKKQVSMSSTAGKKQIPSTTSLEKDLQLQMRRPRLQSCETLSRGPR